jgi:thiosulfate sulfurtransferase
MFTRISISDAASLLATTAAQVVDIRDAVSFQQGRIPKSQALHQDNLQQFVQTADKTLPLLVCCYHGNSSQGAAQMLNEQGFSDVYSIDGGFEAWKLQFPCES